MADCIQVNIPSLDPVEDICNGKRIKTSCVYSEDAITYLGLPVDSTLKQVITALVSKIQEIEQSI